MKYQIGDFSRITSLSIKTIRYYHECGLLKPDYVNNASGYRYYDESSIENANIILKLKNFEFTILSIQKVRV